MSQAFWTNQEKIELIKMRQQGLTLASIANFLGKTEAAVWKRANRNVQNAKTLTENERRIVSLISVAAKSQDPCPTNYEIAAQVGIKATEVSLALKSLSQKGVMETCLNKNRRRVAYIYEGLLSTKNTGSHLEPAFHGQQNPGDTEDRIKISSMNLLRRHLETGAHWIRDPDQFRVACESVGLEVMA